ncbi:MAG: hypothetical protein WKF41_08645 [Gaiellaceae bacterium]
MLEPCVVDEDLNGPRLGDKTRDVGAVGEIGRDDPGAREPGGESVESLAGAVARDDVRAAGREPAHGSEADPGRSPGDERRPAFDRGDGAHA